MIIESTLKYWKLIKVQEGIEGYEIIYNRTERYRKVQEGI